MPHRRPGGAAAATRSGWRPTLRLGRPGWPCMETETAARCISRLKAVPPRAKARPAQAGKREKCPLAPMQGVRARRDHSRPWAPSRGRDTSMAPPCSTPTPRTAPSLSCQPDTRRGATPSAPVRRLARAMPSGRGRSLDITCLLAAVRSPVQWHAPLAGRKPSAHPGTAPPSLFLR